jgi:hypothetical protein
MNARPPAASDSTENIADWVEFEVLRSPNREFSLEGLVRVIRRTGSTDAIAGARGDAGSEISQRVAEDAFAEVENRLLACGDNRYPFDVVPGVLRLKRQEEFSPYVLLLLLSSTKPTSGHDGTAVLFEGICRHAALGYLGGVENGADAIRFGAPRIPPLTKLSAAIDDLCRAIGEGGGCKDPHKARHTGDDELDIVAWRAFPDLKEGKLIAFGQCATGATDWQQKLSRLDGQRFCKKWLRDAYIVDPLRLFFVPRRIPRSEWQHAGIDGGILFDRCRITACLQGLTKDLAQQCKRATRELLGEARKN